jgi:hypothetical protein
MQIRHEEFEGDHWFGIYSKRKNIENRQTFFFFFLKK